MRNTSMWRTKAYKIWWTAANARQLVITWRMKSSCYKEKTSTILWYHRTEVVKSRVLSILYSRDILMSTCHSMHIKSELLFCNPYYVFEHSGMKIHFEWNPVDFQGLARSVLLREWQGKWDSAGTGRFAHSKLPRVFLRPWSKGRQEICFHCIENNVWSLWVDLGLLKKRCVCVFEGLWNSRYGTAKDSRPRGVV
jgi:hypothetical protein